MLKRFKYITGKKAKAVQIPDKFGNPIFPGDWVVQFENDEHWVTPVVYSKEDFERCFKRIR